ncbi:iron chelate uptake ABC transporter family permease subunit [Prauserella flavalba]|uniref:iron chelate uptake ABC transporter family permease subunit n=1 Tax=Prauserella flavalba TaxID=1477506 RepID=UPI0036EFB51B
MLAGLVARPLNAVALGDELAGGATAIAGPIGFVALAAPAPRAPPDPERGVPVLPSAGAGALLTAADGVAQWLCEPVQLPVGV